MERDLASVEAEAVLIMDRAVLTCGIMQSLGHNHRGRTGERCLKLRPRRRVRAGLSLTLGLLIGLALVILPGVLTPSTQTSTSSGSYFGISHGPGVRSMQPGTLANQPNGSSVGSIVGLVLILVSLVLFPAIALSFLARYWVVKKAKERLDRK